MDLDRNPAPARSRTTAIIIIMIIGNWDDARFQLSRTAASSPRRQELTGASIEDEFNLRPPVDQMMTIRAILRLVAFVEHWNHRRPCEASHRGG